MLIDIKSAKTIGELRKMIRTLPDDYSLEEGLSLKDALTYKTVVGELCIILNNCNNSVGAIYIDGSDVDIIIDSSLANKKVIKDEYGTWYVNTNECIDDGISNTVMIPCHKFYIGEEIV